MLGSASKRVWYNEARFMGCFLFPGVSMLSFPLLVSSESLADPTSSAAAFFLVDSKRVSRLEGLVHEKSFTKRSSTNRSGSCG